MADEYLSGKDGFVMVNGVKYPFGEWELDMTGSGMPSVGNFNTSPFDTVVPGIHKGTVRLKGPHNYGNMPLTNLASYVVNLGYKAGVYLTVVLLVALKLANKWDENPTVEVTGKPQGAFSISIL